MGNINQDVAWPDASLILSTYLGSLAIPIRELCYRATANDAAYPVTSLTDTGNKTTNQQNFASYFLGLSHARKVATDAAGTILIDRTAVCQMPCNALSGAAKVGDMIAPSVLTATGGTALTSQIVEITTDATCAIGYVAEAAASGATVLKCLFTSRMVVNGIPNVNQAINTAANLSLTGNLTVGGKMNSTGDFIETGNAAIGGTLAVTGASTLAALGVGAVTSTSTGSFAGLLSTKAGTLAATGTVLGNAAAIVSQTTSVTGVAAAGVKLPAPGTNLGPVLAVFSDPTNAVKVYPNVGSQINGGGANNAVSLTANTGYVFFTDGTSWYYK
jgi:hypothetical protein